MNQLLQWLAGGDLRSDGLSNEAASFVLENPEVFDDLFEGLEVSDDVIRGRAADALEKVSRSRPDLFSDRLSDLFQIAEKDRVPMVLMHVAMMLGHLVTYEEKIDEIFDVLVELLGHESAYVRSWAIVSLCIIGKEYPARCSEVVDLLVPLERDRSVAINTRATKAVHVLTQEGAAFPKGWIKSESLKHFE